jgi:hypothetical protein
MQELIALCMRCEYLERAKGILLLELRRARARDVRVDWSGPSFVVSLMIGAIDGLVVSDIPSGPAAGLAAGLFGMLVTTLACLLGWGWMRKLGSGHWGIVSFVVHAAFGGWLAFWLIASAVAQGLNVVEMVSIGLLASGISIGCVVLIRRILKHAFCAAVIGVVLGSFACSLGASCAVVWLAVQGKITPPIAMVFLPMASVNGVILGALAGLFGGGALGAIARSVTRDRKSFGTTVEDRLSSGTEFICIRRCRERTCDQSEEHPPWDDLWPVWFGAILSERLRLRLWRIKLRFEIASLQTIAGHDFAKWLAPDATGNSRDASA